MYSPNDLLHESAFHDVIHLFPKGILLAQLRPHSVQWPAQKLMDRVAFADSAEGVAGQAWPRQPQSLGVHVEQVVGAWKLNNGQSSASSKLIPTWTEAIAIAFSVQPRSNSPLCHCP